MQRCLSFRVSMQPRVMDSTCIAAPLLCEIAAGVFLECPSAVITEGHLSIYLSLDEHTAVFISLNDVS